MTCIFCEIVDGKLPASVIYRDERCMAFMGIRPTHPGECMVIPLAHIDHFTDVDEETAAHIMVIGHRIGRRILKVFGCERTGLVVHGFGVPHAHLILVPQHFEDDIVSARHLKIVDGKAYFSGQHLEKPPRAVLDRHAKQLRLAFTL